jgi:hypothetical protein
VQVRNNKNQDNAETDLGNIDIRLLDQERILDSNLASFRVQEELPDIRRSMGIPIMRRAKPSA